MRFTAGVLALSLALSLAAGAAAADVVVLHNGDRVTGKVTGSVARRVRIETPYGVLVIPTDKVERIHHDDGREEVLVTPTPTTAPPAPRPAPTPAQATLVLVVTGATFWQAWDPKAAPEDPSLRLEVRLDDEAVATYTDVNLDPEDMPKAVVNSFVFSPERLFVSGAQGVTVSPPSLVASEIRLSIQFPPRLAGERRLSIAYQVNDAGSAAPHWRNLVSGGTTITLAAGRTVRARLVQDRGTMEYSRRQLRGVGQMRGVETFHATIEVEPSS